MEHHFNVEVATKYGVDVAVFLNNLAFWIQKNSANDRHAYEGRYWTYNSQKAFSILFPYWTRQNLRTIIKKCIDQKLMVIGNFNQSKYDHTSWYALTDLGLSLFPTIGYNQPLKEIDSTTSLVGINQPIPDNKPYNNTDNTPLPPKTGEAEFVLPDWIDKEAWDFFVDHRKQKKKPLTAHAKKLAIQQLDKLRAQGNNVKDVINQTILNSWSGFFAISTPKQPITQTQKYAPTQNLAATANVSSQSTTFVKSEVQKSTSDFARQQLKGILKTVGRR